MIGNDIVDLQLAEMESRWQRPRFLTKLFSEQEQELIQSAPLPAARVWLLWSMKESAYKIWMQQGGKRFFGPKEFQCQVDFQAPGVASGHVYFQRKVFVTTSKLYDQFIYTQSVCQNRSPFELDFTQIYRLTGDDQSSKSKNLHQQLKVDFAAKLNLKPALLRIQKNEQGIPSIWYGKNQVASQISLSHHGRYGAFSWCFDKSQLKQFN